MVILPRRSTIVYSAYCTTKEGEVPVEWYCIHTIKECVGTSRMVNCNGCSPPPHICILGWPRYLLFSCKWSGNIIPPGGAGDKPVRIRLHPDCARSSHAIIRSELSGYALRIFHARHDALKKYATRPNPDRLWQYSMDLTLPAIIRISA
jgi:hypothetical protein